MGEGGIKFRGSFRHTVDQKGRVSVPARFRELVVGSGSNVVILTHSIHNPCIDAFPLAEYEAAESRFDESARRARMSAQQRNHFYNVVVGNATECEIDDQGRILIPPKIRDDFRLDREVVFSGAGKRFRIWREDVWQEEQEKAAMVLQADPAILDVLDF